MTNEQIEKIKQQIRIPHLSISRCPSNTVKRFLEICSMEDFCDDRGMLLKFLVDTYDGIIQTGIEHLEIELQQQRQEIEQIKQSIAIKEHKPDKVRRMLSGRRLKEKNEQGEQKNG